MRTCGLFFGSFNPLHIGHLAILNYVCAFGELDQVRLVLSPRNPLKHEPHAAADGSAFMGADGSAFMGADGSAFLAADLERLQLLQRVMRAKGLPVTVSDVEFHLPLPHYTIRTLHRLQALEPETRFVLILGADNLALMERWYAWQEILAGFEVWIYPRQGFDAPALAQQYAAYAHWPIRVLDAPLVTLSSTFIRQALAQGKNMNGFLAEPLPAPEPDGHASYPIFTSEQTRQLDAYTIAHEPISQEALIERASARFVEALLRYVDREGCTPSCVAVVAGPGNNGADALAVARGLEQAGYPVHVFDFGHNPKLEANALKPILATPGVAVVDGLFGSGLNRPLEGRYAAVVQTVNNAGVPVYAIDNPSGLMAEGAACTAADAAVQTAGAANQAAGVANQIADQAVQTAGEANQAAGVANQTVDQAAQAAGAVNQAPGVANQIADQAAQAIGAANQAPGAANQTVDQAAQAAGAANQAAGAVNQTVDQAAQAPAPVMQATATFSFEFPKLAFLLADSGPFAGDWHVVPIGLHPQAVAQTNTPYYLTGWDDVRGVLDAQRLAFSHKGTFGHALLVAGSHEKTGAALLAAAACLRSGAGLLTVHIPQNSRTLFLESLPEAMLSIDEHPHLFSTAPSWKETYRAVAIGPGLGQAPCTASAFLQLLSLLRAKPLCPVVFDADALNLLAAHPQCLLALPPLSVLTPHPGEFDRLAAALGYPPATSAYQRLEQARRMACSLRTVVVLKGRYTAVCSCEGMVWINPTGNPGMATGGSGDVLTGVLLGLLAQRSYFSKWQGRLLPLSSLVVAGVYLHGLAGDRAAALSQAFGPRGDALGATMQTACAQAAVLAGDVVQALPKVLD